MQSKQKQKGFIGSIFMLATIIGLVVLVFAGKVVYNKFTDQNVIFSFNMFDHTFEMTQRQSLSSKIKEGLNDGIDAVTNGAKETKKAVEDIVDERGGKKVLEDVSKKGTEIKNNVKETVTVTINDVEQKMTEDEAKKLKNDTVGFVSGVLNSVSKSLDNMKSD